MGWLINLHIKIKERKIDELEEGRWVISLCYLAPPSFVNPNDFLLLPVSDSTEYTHPRIIPCTYKHMLVTESCSRKY